MHNKIINILLLLLFDRISQNEASNRESSLAHLEQLYKPLFAGLPVDSRYFKIFDISLPNITFVMPELTTDCAADLAVLLPDNNDFSSLTAEQTQILMSMVDASGKLPAGIMRGNTKLLGLYSECAAIKTNMGNRSIRGGYGRLFIDQKLRDYEAPDACQASALAFSGWTFDACVPLACSDSRNLRAIGNAFRVNGNRVACTALSIIEQGRKTDYRTWIVVVVLCLVGVLAIVASIYDYYFSPEFKKRFAYNKWIQCLLAFSFYSNVCQIFNLDNVNKPGQIGAIHFMRFISICWVMLGHVCIMTVLISGNTLDTLVGQKDVTTQFLTNSYFAVDTFFFMSGLLLAFIWFKDYYKNPRRQMSAVSWIMFYVHRILRLSPSYYLIIAFYSFVYKTFMINMPDILIPFPDSCEKNWWINYLYLTNYIDYKNQCYLVSWYLATDLQMFIFAPVILIPLAIKPLYGFISAIVILLASTAGNLATEYHYYFPPSDYTLGHQDPRMKDFNLYTLMIYDAPWIRCQVYIIGMLTGYLLQTKKKLRIPYLVNIVLWIVSLGLGLTVIFVLKDWTNGKYFTLSESAFYSAFSKIAWALALSYIVTSCYYGYGGPINRFMSCGMWAPFGRLAYCSYLIHFMIIYYLMGMNNSPWMYTNFSFSFVTMTLPIICITFFFALFWSALFEIPSAKVEMIFLGAVRGRKAAEGVKAETNEEKTQPVNGKSEEIKL